MFSRLAQNHFNLAHPRVLAPIRPQAAGQPREETWQELSGRLVAGGTYGAKIGAAGALVAGGLGLREGLTLPGLPGAVAVGGSMGFAMGAFAAFFDDAAAAAGTDDSISYIQAARGGGAVGLSATAMTKLLKQVGVIAEAVERDITLKPIIGRVYQIATEVMESKLGAAAANDFRSKVPQAAIVKSLQTVIPLGAVCGAALSAGLVVFIQNRIVVPVLRTTTELLLIATQSVHGLSNQHQERLAVLVAWSIMTLASLSMMRNVDPLFIGFVALAMMNALSMEIFHQAGAKKAMAAHFGNLLVTVVLPVVVFVLATGDSVDPQDPRLNQIESLRPKFEAIFTQQNAAR